jgi:predicted kinase
VSRLDSDGKIFPSSVLYIFGGLPGTGKSTLSLTIASELRAVHLRIDTIEGALRAARVWVDGPAGYVVGYRLAADNLRLGLPVVADSVNPLPITRSAWREAARDVGAPFVEIEVICSDKGEHRRRIEARLRDNPGTAGPTWDDVMNREYQPWPKEHIVIDTAGQTPPQSVAVLRQFLGLA